MKTIFHLRVCALIHRRGQFLVVRTKGGNHSFFLGGHVETGESIVAALKREILEECGRDAEIKEYLGAIENAWIEDDVKQWEIAHFFHAVIPDIESKSNILSLEPHIKFFWTAPEKFKRVNLLPMPLRNLAKAWAEGDKKIWWASTI